MKQWYIAIATAVVYLAVSVLFKAWSWSWFIWVIYALYRFLCWEGLGAGGEGDNRRCDGWMASLSQ